jgi:hypothetical protein
VTVFLPRPEQGSPATWQVIPIMPRCAKPTTAFASRQATDQARPPLLPHASPCSALTLAATRHRMPAGARRSGGGRWPASGPFPAPCLASPLPPLPCCSPIKGRAGLPATRASTTGGLHCREHHFHAEPLPPHHQSSDSPSSVAKPPELFRLKCASHRYTADINSTHFKRNNPLVCQVSARYNHGSTGSKQVYLARRRVYNHTTAHQLFNPQHIKHYYKPLQT